MIAYQNMTGLPETLNVEEGASLVVHCLCMSDITNVTTLSWNRGPRSILEVPTLGVVAVLNFTAVGATDGGMYNCSSSANVTEVASFTLQVVGEYGCACKCACVCSEKQRWLLCRTAADPLCCRCPFDSQCYCHVTGGASTQQCVAAVHSFWRHPSDLLMATGWWHRVRRDHAHT